MQFVNLHQHSSASVMDAMSSPKLIASTVAKYGQYAAALTDHGCVGNAIKFYQSCIKENIRPILGCEMYVTTYPIAQRENNFNSHVVILAKGERGWKNLLRLICISELEGFYKKPRIDIDILDKHHDGLIAISGHMGSWGNEREIFSAIDRVTTQQIHKRIGVLKDIFGEDYYLEAQRHKNKRDLETACADKICSAGAELGIKTIATADSHFVVAEDFLAHKCLIAARWKSVRYGKDDPRNTGEKDYPYDESYCIPTTDYMVDNFSDHLDYIDNTNEIASKIGYYNLPLGGFHLPKYAGMDTDAEKAYLIATAYRKLVELGIDTDEYRNRLAYELDIVTSYGFAGYYLVNADIMNWCETANIPRGIARGSGGGSLLAYCLNITQMDPIKYGLIFSRFLNEGRLYKETVYTYLNNDNVIESSKPQDGFLLDTQEKTVIKSLPDFDNDVSQKHRGKVLEHIQEQYGYCAHIATSTKLTSKTALKLVGRSEVLSDISFVAINEFTKLLNEKISLEDNLKNNKLKTMAEEIGLMPLMPIAARLEGIPGSRGIHASGVVISDTPLWETFPLRHSDDGLPIVDYDMFDVEACGYPKFDILGLRNLDVLHDTQQLYRSNRNKDLIIDIDDPDIYKGVNGLDNIFQIESEIGQKYYKKAQPKNVRDVSALVAAIRPGVLQAGQSDHWAQNDFVNSVPLLDNICSETNNIMLYQEQMMEAAKQMAGFTMPEADDLRKAIGKKIPELMAKMIAKFIAGARANGYDDEQIQYVVDVFKASADYSFNKSHSMAYAIISAQCLYCKHYALPEYYVAILNSVSGNIKKTRKILNDIIHNKLSISLPDINLSEYDCTVVDERVLLGFGLVKSLGSAAIDVVMNLRPFNTLEDFLQAPKTKLNMTARKALISAGALDGLKNNKGQSLNRGELLWMVDKRLPLTNYTVEEYGSMEQDVLGYYFTANPYINMQCFQKKNAYNFTVSDINEESCDSFKIITGILRNIKEKTAKTSKKPYIECDVIDPHGSLPAKMFSKNLDKYRDIIQLAKQRDIPLAIKVFVESDEYQSETEGEEVISLILHELTVLEDTTQQKDNVLHIKPKNKQAGNLLPNLLASLELEFSGNNMIEYKNSTYKIALTADIRNILSEYVTNNL